MEENWTHNPEIDGSIPAADTGRERKREMSKTNISVEFNNNTGTYYKTFGMCPSVTWWNKLACLSLPENYNNVSYSIAW